MVTDGSHFKLAFQSNSVGWRQTARASGQQFCIETDDDFDWGGPFMRSASRSPFLHREHAGDYTGVNAERDLKNCVSP